MQMMAASGHVTLVPELLNGMILVNATTTKSTNLKLVEQALEQEQQFNASTAHLVLIADRRSDLAAEFVQHNPSLVDGLIIIDQKSTVRTKAEAAAIKANKFVVFVEHGDADEENSHAEKSPLIKYVNVRNPSNVESAPKLTQIFANFLDFVHPR